MVGGLVFLGGLVFVSGLSEARAVSEVVFSPAFFYKSQETKAGSSESERTEMLFDLRLGYILDSSIYVGAIYAQDTIDTGNSEAVRSSYGPSVGFFQDSFALLLHYFLSSELDDDSTVYEGSGLQVDVGYYMKVGSNSSLGPQISWKKFTYNKLDGNTLSPKIEVTKLDPYVVFAYRF